MCCRAPFFALLFHWEKRITVMSDEVKEPTLLGSEEKEMNEQSNEHEQKEPTEPTDQTEQIESNEESNQPKEEPTEESNQPKEEPTEESNQPNEQLNEEPNDYNANVDDDDLSHEASDDNLDDYDEDDNVYSIKAHKLDKSNATTKKKNVRKRKAPEVNRTITENKPVYSQHDDVPEEPSPLDEYRNEDPASRRRRLLEEKMDLAIKTRTVRRKKDEDDIERMQDDKIDDLKDQMIKAANLDVEKNSQGQIATEKLKLLQQVADILSRADLAISILDNNLLEAVRLWLEPLPDASMPAYQIQKLLISSLETLPIKTDHLVASGIGKVLVFYQRSKRTEPGLKKIVDKLIGDWTRPILNKSDSYKDRTIQFSDYDKNVYANKLASARASRPKEAKTLYEQNAARRKRAAIPSARTAAYKIAPRVDPSLIRRQQTRNLGTNDERFKRLNLTLTSMSVKKKTTKKGGPSIEGRNLAM